ncbi:MAG: 6-bladed beta-propeller [Methanoregula sp.]
MYSRKWIIVLIILMLYCVVIVQSVVAAETYTCILKWGSTGSDPGQFQQSGPYGITVDSVGGVYVVDSGNSRVQKFSSDGIFQYQWGSQGFGNYQFQSPTGIAIDSTNHVTVTMTNKVKQYSVTDTGATFIRDWGSYGTGDGQFQNYPWLLGVDPAGNLYIPDRLNQRVQVFDPSGNFIRKWGQGGSGNGDFNFPNGAAVDHQGNVWITDDNGIQKFSPTGSFISKWPVGYHQGIAVDNNGNIYTAAIIQDKVQKFGPDGTLLAEWGTTGTGLNQFYHPVGIAVDSQGYVYVTDQNFVRKFEKTIDVTPTTCCCCNCNIPSNITVHVVPLSPLVPIVCLTLIVVVYGIKKKKKN